MTGCCSHSGYRKRGSRGSAHSLVWVLRVSFRVDLGAECVTWVVLQPCIKKQVLVRTQEGPGCFLEAQLVCASSTVSSCGVPGGDSIFKNILFETATSASQLFLSLMNTEDPFFCWGNQCKRDGEGRA